jgi:hypothetical protein
MALKTMQKGESRTCRFSPPPSRWFAQIAVEPGAHLPDALAREILGGRLLARFEVAQIQARRAGGCVFPGKTMAMRPTRLRIVLVLFEENADGATSKLARRAGEWAA